MTGTLRRTTTWCSTPGVSATTPRWPSYWPRSQAARGNRNPLLPAGERAGRGAWSRYSVTRGPRTRLAHVWRRRFERGRPHQHDQPAGSARAVRRRAAPAAPTPEPQEQAFGRASPGRWGLVPRDLIHRGTAERDSRAMAWT